MPVRLVSPAEVVVSGKKTEKIFEKAPQWAETKKLIDAGHPKGECRIELSLSPADLRKLDIKTDRTVVRFLKDYLADNHINCAVYVRRKDGVSYIYIKRKQAKAVKHIFSTK